MTNPIESDVGGHSYPQAGNIQTQGFDADEDLQVINASPSESGAGDEQPFAWSSIVGAVFGGGAGTSSAAPDSPAISPGGIPPSQRATNIHESIDRGEEESNIEELNRSPVNEPTSRPSMNGRAATRDSEVGIERFTTARSSLDVRRSVAV